LATILQEEFLRLGLSISPEIQEKLETYVRELEHWNRRINLTSLRGGDLIRRLVVEPGWISTKLQMSGNLMDVGSGNGCPAIPLYLLCGLSRVDLVEARTRRAAFLRHIAKQLGADGMVIHKLRLEEMKELPVPADWVTFQGVDPSPKFIEILGRLVPSTTRIVWITSRQLPAWRCASRISVPNSKTVAWVAQMDTL
jgi:16S rRNA (guanine(527)-N(7))-methyltransferase RsmG